MSTPDDPLHPLVAAERQRSIILRVVRFTFFILIVTVALVTLFNEAGPPGTETGISLVAPWWLPVALAVSLFVVALAIDISTPNKKISTISGVFLGLFAGLLATVAFSMLIDLVLGAWLPANTIVQFKAFTGLLKVLVGMALCYLGIVTVLQTQDDFRLVIPYVEFAKQIRGVKPLLLDTSALIDARIVDLAASGLIQSPIVVPRFVIAELQTLADSSDKLKRARGRRGLDVVGKLQRVGRVDVTIEDTTPAILGVDQSLVDLAQQISGRILTTDMGLTRVAQIHGVIVLNIHEIAAALRPSLIPGEQISLRIVKAGEQAGQGVGYLDDGTMVVVDNALRKVGEDVMAVVSSTMQTAAGRLVFARMLEIVSSQAAPASAAQVTPHPASHGDAATDPRGALPLDRQIAEPEHEATPIAAIPSVEPQVPSEVPASAIARPASPTPPHSPSPGPHIRRESTGRNPRR